MNWIAFFFFLWYFYSSPFLLLRKEVSRDGSRRRGGGNDTLPPPVELTLSSSQKVTVMRECGSHRCSHLSDLGSPDIGRGRRKWSQMIGGGTPNGSGVPFPSTEVNTKKVVFGQVSWQTDDSHFYSGLKTKHWDTRDSKILQASIENSTKSISPWRKRNSPVEPCQKNKISNFRTFSVTPNFCYHSLSLSIWKRIKARKRHLYSWTILLYIFDILNVYIYITVVKNLCIFILPCGLCYYFMLSFQLLFALHYLA